MRKTDADLADLARLPNGMVAANRDVAHIWKQRGARRVEPHMGSPKMGMRMATRPLPGTRAGPLALGGKQFIHT